MLLKEVDCWWIIGFKEWFGGFFRFVGIVSDVGDECVLEWEINFGGVFWFGDKELLSGGCLKNDGGSFCKCIGRELVDEVGLGCVLVIVFLLMIWKSVLRLLLEFCCIWII